MLKIYFYCTLIAQILKSMFKNLTFHTIYSSIVRLLLEYQQLNFTFLLQILDIQLYILEYQQHTVYIFAVSKQSQLHYNKETTRPSRNFCLFKIYLLVSLRDCKNRCKTFLQHRNFPMTKSQCLFLIRFGCPGQPEAIVCIC